MDARAGGGGVEARDVGGGGVEARIAGGTAGALPETMAPGADGLATTRAGAEAFSTPPLATDSVCVSVFAVVEAGGALLFTKRCSRGS
jgi:hypothetical protein